MTLGIEWYDVYVMMHQKEIDEKKSINVWLNLKVEYEEYTKRKQ